MPSDTPPPRRLGATRARQGRLGRPVVWVLVISTVLAAIALFGGWAWRSDDLASTAPDNGRQISDATAFDAPAPAPVTQQTAPGPK